MIGGFTFHWPTHIAIPGFSFQKARFSAQIHRRSHWLALVNANRIGRPRRIFDRQEVLRLRESGMSIERIAKQMCLGVGTVVRVMRANKDGTGTFQKAST